MLRDALRESIERSLPPQQAPRSGQVTGAPTQHALTELIRLLSPAAVLEIGSFFADSARVMAAKMAELGEGHLTTIDPFGADRVPEIIAGWPVDIQERVTFRPDNSMSFFLYLDEEVHAKRGREAPFNIVFVDGHHSFDYAFYDLMRSALFLQPGGALVVDNIEQPGPAAAVKLFLERYTRWQLFKAAGPDHALSFHPAANSAVILAPDGIEIGPLPYRIDMYGLAAAEIPAVQVRVVSGATGLLRVLTNFYARPGDYAVTGVGEKGCIGVAERRTSPDDRGTIAMVYDPPLKLALDPQDHIAAQIELSFDPDGGQHLLAEAEPITLLRQSDNAPGNSI